MFSPHAKMYLYEVIQYTLTRLNKPSSADQSLMVCLLVPQSFKDTFLVSV